MIKGIDISEWQSKIPAFEGDFIIIRAGFGYEKDGRFDNHYENALKLGKKVGVYWYSYALNKEKAKIEAQKCLEIIKNRDISLGVWFDMEDADGYKNKNGFVFNKTNVSAICNSFCEEIEKAGYYAGIYANLNYLKNYIDCPMYDKWAAAWGNNDGTIPAGLETEVRKYGASIWQYTSKLNGKSQDGDVLLHNDIEMYNVQPKTVALEVKKIAKEILADLEKVKEKVNKLL